MGKWLNQIPEKLHSHIKQITKTSGLAETEESIEKIAKGWFEKKNAFEEKIINLGMQEVESFQKDDFRGALALTYSGSLVIIGPVINNIRKAQYISIGLRKDVPDIADKEDSNLSKAIAIDDTIEFEPGPVKSTSQVFKIAVLIGKFKAIEQEKKISEATQVITKEFIKVNKTMVSK